jgi:hypothetical protein
MLAVIVLVAILHNLSQFVFVRHSGIHEFFDVAYEQNFPTWVASIFWFVLSSSAFLCFRESTGAWWKRLPWLMVAVIFLGASIDEISELHENIGQMLHEQQIAGGDPELLREGSPGSPWIGFFAPFLAVSIIGMLVFFVRTLQRRLFWTCIAGFCCFLAALSMDFYQGMYDPYREKIAQAVHLDTRTLVHASIAVEEHLELLGMTLLTYAFVEHWLKIRRAKTT